MSEHQTQAAFVQYCRLHEGKYPQLKLAFAIPNAAKRSKALGGMMKAEGLRAGVWDWCLPWNNGQHNGLWIEFKHGSNRLTELQLAYGRLLVQYGHKVAICYTVDEAMAALAEYLKNGGSLLSKSRPED